MKTFTVHHKTGDADSIITRPEQVVFVPEAFSWMAFIVPLFWLLFHRMWVVAAIFFAVFSMVSAVGIWLGLSSWVMVLLDAALSLFIALEGNELRRWSLERRGFKMINIISGRSKPECELEFFRRLTAEKSGPAARPASQRTPQRLADQPGEGGMFPVTGGDA